MSKKVSDNILPKISSSSKKKKQIKNQNSKLNNIKYEQKSSVISKTIENVPVALSFIQNNITAIIGTASNKTQFIEGLILPEHITRIILMFGEYCIRAVPAVSAPP